MILLPCKVTAESPYMPAEWGMIEKLASAKGKIYKSVKKLKSILSQDRIIYEGIGLKRLKGDYWEIWKAVDNVKYISHF